MAATKPSLTTRDVRLAVAHLIQLATAFEKAGGRTDVDAMNALVKCIRSVKTHKKRHSAERNRVVSALLMREVASIYSEVKRVPTIAPALLRAKLKRCVSPYLQGQKLERALDGARTGNGLVVTEDQISDDNGPVECAAKRVNWAFGGHPQARTLHYQEKRNAKYKYLRFPRIRGGQVKQHYAVPLAFGVRVTETELAKYAATALRERLIPPPDMFRPASKATPSTSPGKAATFRKSLLS
jgi:hypothetical protein